MDIQATSELIKWTVNIITLILVIIAGSLAAKKKQNIAILILFIVNAFALFVLFSPILGFINKEATLSDSTGQMIGIGFIIFGVFMIIGNVISMIKGEPASNAPIKSSSEERLKTEKQIRCRFCKKLYSSEYNGCPHCKKK